MVRVVVGVIGWFGAESAIRAEVYSHGDPTPQEQYLLELINRARANPGAEAALHGIGLNDNLSPGQISSSPKQPLAFHPSLITSARAHSQWMLDVDVFDHTGLNGSSPTDRMNDAGYDLGGFWGTGENIAWQGTSGTPPLNAYVAQEHAGLFRSPPHRINLMNPEFDEVGTGVKVGAFRVSGANYNTVMVTENFAYSGSTPGPLLLGVVFRDANKNSFYDPGEGVSGVTVSAVGQAHSALTSASGGYAFPYSGNGVMQVAFSLDGVTQHAVVAVKRTGDNVKADWVVPEVVTSPIVLSGIKRLGNGSAEFQVQGGKAGAARVEWSDNLQAWNLLSNVTLTAVPLKVTDAGATGRSRTYYRVQQ